MPAYVIVEAEVLDEELALAYRALARPSIELHGGRYVVRGAAPEVVEGASWPGASSVVTVVEFPDPDALRTWYASPEYQEAKAARGAGIALRMLFVPGLPG
jgi:uncharacterized protein (DUF1330 family)